MKYQSIVLIAAASLLPLGLPAQAQAQTTEAASTTAANDLGQTDKDFVQAASMSSSTEIDASKLAVTHSTDKDVRKFAAKMVLDHTKLTVQLKMAAPSGVVVPKDNSDVQVLDSLKSLKGKQFDDAYIRQVALEGHKKAVAAFSQEAEGGQDAKLKAAAQKALPIIQHHYEMAQALASKKGVSE